MYKFSDRIKDMNGTATREILKLTARPEVISFAGGMPAKECIPCDIIKDIADDILSSGNAPSVLSYGRTEGTPEFLDVMRGYMRDLGLSAEAENLQVLSGGQQGLDLMCKAFINKGDVILVENPTYLAFLQIAKTYEAKVIGVDADESGLVLSDLENKLKKYSPKLLYVVPTFSNPTGKTYTAENRKEIVRLCEKYGTVIIEDDPYGRLRYAGNDVPLLKSFDACGIAVYITSFSKTVAPGLRTAVACGAPEIIRKISIGKQGADVQSPALCQGIIAEYFKRGHYYPVIEKCKATYRARKDAMLAALERYMPEEVKFTRPDGGLFIWLVMPSYIDAKELLPVALSRNVAFINGNEFFADGSGHNTARLNFSCSDAERIDKGIGILSEIIKQAIKEKKHE